jgi:hypothetical protein
MSAATAMATGVEETFSPGEPRNRAKKIAPQS